MSKYLVLIGLFLVIPVLVRCLAYFVGLQVEEFKRMSQEYGENWAVWVLGISISATTVGMMFYSSPLPQ